MIPTPESQIFTAIAHRIDPLSTMRRSWRLTGGVSAEITALEIERADGQMLQVVVRKYGATDLSQNRNVAEHEFRLLRVAREHSLTVPEPHFFDDSGSLLTSPFVVVEYVDGTTEFEPADIESYAD